MSLKTYSIHIRRHGLNPDRDIIVIRDDFSWMACLFGPLWAVWHRAWWALLALITAQLAVFGLISGLGMDETGRLIISSGFALAIGFLASDIRRWKMDRQGFREAGYVLAKDEDTALLRYFDNHNNELAEML